MMKSRKKTGRHAVRSAENSSYSGKSFTSPYDASAYSRHGNVEQYHDASRKQKKHHKRKVGMTVAAIFLVVVLAGVGVAFAFISNIDRNLQDGLDEDLLASLTASDSPSEPFYMLLIGVDKSEEREESDIYGGAYRTDSMILTRVDPRNTKITMVSIYRDTMVELPGYGKQKIKSMRLAVLKSMCPWLSMTPLLASRLRQVRKRLMVHKRSCSVVRVTPMISTVMAISCVQRTSAWSSRLS